MSKGKQGFSDHLQHFFTFLSTTSPRPFKYLGKKGQSPKTMGMLRTFCAQFRSFSYGIYRLPPPFWSKKSSQIVWKATEKKHHGELRPCTTGAPWRQSTACAWLRGPRCRDLLLSKGCFKGKKMLVQTRVFVQSFSHQGGKKSVKYSKCSFQI